MEILKKTIIAAFLVIAVQVQLSAKQPDADEKLKAYSASYSSELKGDYTGAIRALSPIYEENGYEVNLRMGWLYYEAKSYNTSETYYAKAVALKPMAIEAKFGLIKPLAALESWDKVMAQYDAILKLDEANTSARYYKGYIYYTRKQYDQAKQQFSKVLALYPFDYESNLMTGWATYLSGDKIGAHAYFVKALMIKPGDSSASDGFTKSR